MSSVYLLIHKCILLLLARTLCLSLFSLSLFHLASDRYGWVKFPRRCVVCVEGTRDVQEILLEVLNLQSVDRSQREPSLLTWQNSYWLCDFAVLRIAVES